MTEAERAECPTCKHHVQVLPNGQLAHHYPSPGVGLACPPAQPAEEKAS